MNRRHIVERTLVVLLPLLGFALVYGLPMLGLNFAIDHGLYVAAASAVVPAVRSLRTVIPTAFWVDEDGTEHAIESITPQRSFPGWKLVRFTDESMDTSLVQERHIVVRTPDTEGVQTANTLPLGSQEKMGDPPLFRASPENHLNTHLFRDVAEVIGGVLESEYPLNSHVAGVDEVGGAA